MRQPHINFGAMRGFEAAARHLSFTAAADELHITQGAISRQVATLERDLGVKLFKRLTRRIELTAAGAEFFKAAQGALRTLDRAAARIGGVQPAQTLTVSVLPTIGSVWLMPRLHRFTDANRGVEVRIVTSIEPVDLKAGAVDVAIRVGSPPHPQRSASGPRIDLRMTTKWKDVSAQELFADTLVPVISRRVGRGLKELSPREILGHLPLIHISTRRRGWPDWLHAHGLSAPSRQPALEFGHFFMALEAARAGRGIALVPAVVLPDLDYRRQLQILDFALTPSAGTYHVLTADTQSASPVLRSFVAWLEAEAATLRSRTRRLLQQTCGARKVSDADRAA